MRNDERLIRKNMTGAETGGDRTEIDELLLKNRALDAAAEGITIADARLPDQPLIYVNKGFERLTGYPADGVLGRNCRFLQGDSSDPSTVSDIRHAIQEGRECVVELLNYRKDGTPFWNRLSITPVTDDSGEVTHFIGVQSDVTARKNAEDELSRANVELARANRRISEDLESAAKIQQGFLPPEMIDIEGLDIAWALRPCDELAGDTLNVVPLDERHVEFYAIDVSGHGVPAALLSVTLNHFLAPAGGRLGIDHSPQATDGERIVPPAEITNTLNKKFPYDIERNQFFTLVYGVYDIENRVFSFVSAGHPPLIHLPRSGESRHQWALGPPIGIKPDFEYKQNTLEMAPGDRIYLYSDGLIEVFDHNQEPFGVERLTEALKNSLNQPLEASVSSVIKEVEAWGRQAPFDDDVSILAFEAR